MLPSAAQSAPRVKALRTELAKRGLTGFVVPHADCHQSEYLPASEERLAWLTGFTGSAGAAIVLMERAALFVDGRYTLQAREQADTSLFEIVHLVETPPDQWIERTLAKGDALGFDPWLHTVEGAEKLAARLRQCRRNARPDRAQSDRRIVEGPPCPAARRGDAARHPLCRRSRRDQALDHPSRDREAQGRRAGRVRSACGRLDLQHPRLRRLAHAAAALLRHHPARRPPVAVHRWPQAWKRRAPSARRARGRARARAISPASSPRWARPARPCASTRHRRRRAGADRRPAPAAR